MTDLRQAEYNKFTYFPDIPYKIVEYLISNDETIWKLLYYNTPDAYNKPNLTSVQKGALVYNGIMPETDARVFLNFGQDEAWTEQVAMLRVSVVDAVPTTYIWGHMKISFQVFSHYKIDQLSNYKSRIDMIIQRLIEIFNGADLGTGIGRLYFNYQMSTASRVTITGNAPYKGKILVMCNTAL